MSVHRESESKLSRYGGTLCGVFTHALCALFTGFIAALSRPGSSLFSWHPFLMTLAFSFFMTEAVLLFNPYSSPVKKLKHKAKGRLHWLLQGSCVCCAVAGLAAVFYNKHLGGKPHFSTWHGALGALTVAAAGLQALGGLPLLHPKLARGRSRAELKRYHAASGLLAYLLGSSSLFLGLRSAWFGGVAGGFGGALAPLCPVLCALVVMSQVTNAYMARKPMQY
ncbi:transmembrane reductase CYB561D2 [Puntigrus tetrazona]|uniref:transmembrane reductase CYB561D2 n=1 Tax=Puntigrus tetrazona TaxID=1606681 RepID=UPI001C89B87C|nr:transmembrane reductase CYB561D2 [Puntigrus tetrazona]